MSISAHKNWKMFFGLIWALPGVYWFEFRFWLRYHAAREVEDFFRTFKWIVAFAGYGTGCVISCSLIPHIDRIGFWAIMPLVLGLLLTSLCAAIEKIAHRITVRR